MALSDDFVVFYPYVWDKDAGVYRRGCDVDSETFPYASSRITCEISNTYGATVLAIDPNDPWLDSNSIPMGTQTRVITRLKEYSIPEGYVARFVDVGYETCYVTMMTEEEPVAPDALEGFGVVYSSAHGVSGIVQSSHSVSLIASVLLEPVPEPTPPEEKLVKFGTLSNMLSTYKGLSDEELDRKLAELNVGGGGYTLPAATKTTLGGVKAGSNVTIASDGTISVAAPYTLPKASASTLGGVKVGDGLSVASDGTLSAQGGGEALPRDYVRRVIRTQISGVPYIRFFVATAEGEALVGKEYGTTWKVAHYYTAFEDFADADVVASTATQPYVSIREDVFDHVSGGIADYDNLAIMRNVDGEWVLTGMYCNPWKGVLNKPFETLGADFEAAGGVLSLAKAVRNSIEGVVLYSNEALDDSVQSVKLEGVNAEDYSRFEVILTDHARAGALSSVNRSAGRVVFSTEYLSTLSSTRAKSITQFAAFQHDLNEYNKVYLNYVQMYISQVGVIEFYAEDNVTNFVLSADGTNATAAIKPSGTYYVRIDKVVGYPKLPEVA